MLDDSKQARDSYDQTHRTHRAGASPFDEMIRIADQERARLAGEREAELRELHLQELFGPTEEELAHDLHTKGLPEGMDAMLGRQVSDFDWYRTTPEGTTRIMPNGEAWDAEASDASGWTASEKEAYGAALDEEYNEYWSKHCIRHHDELREGRCMQCDGELADERRNDL